MRTLVAVSSRAMPFSRLGDVSRFARKLHDRALVAWIAAGVISCAPGPVPCGGGDRCPPGEECLANRCVPLGGDPVPPDSLRLVCPLTGSRVALQGRLQTPLSPQIHLGRDVETAYFQFERRWQALSRIDAAFLVIDTPPPPALPLEVEVWSIRPEDSAGGFGARPPQAEPPNSRGVARAGVPLRVDVTELVQHWHESGLGDGLAVSAAAPTGGLPSTALVLGTAGGQAPRLEVYGR